MSRKKAKIRRPKAKKKNDKLWGLEPRTFSRGARPFMDQDYVNELNEDEKRFLSEFNETYYGNKFPRNSKPGRKTNLFDRAGVARKEIYDQTNARNRDVHTAHYKINADQGHLVRGEEGERVSLVDRNRESIEEDLVNYLDYTRLVDKLMKKGYNEKEARQEAEYTLFATRSWADDE